MSAHGSVLVRSTCSTYTLRYLAVILMLFVINATRTDAEQGNWWVLYPPSEWGVALVVHAVLTVTGGLSSWDEHEVKSSYSGSRSIGPPRSD